MNRLISGDCFVRLLRAPYRCVWGTRCWRSVALFACVLLASIYFHTSANASDGLATANFFLQSGFGHQEGPFSGAVDVNTLLGANRFYDAGFTGTQAVMANIEAGHIWNGHETLTHVGLIPTSGAALGQYDRHASWIGLVMGGRPGGEEPGPYQMGMAPDAQLFSGAIATAWPSGSGFPRYTAGFNFSFSNSTYGPYRAAIATGITGLDGSRTADVVNLSYSISNVGSGLTGTDAISGMLDALVAENPRTLLTVAAGNTLPSGAGPNRVPSPATAYNVMTVAALAPNGNLFNVPSVFSNGGPNNYDDPTVPGVISEARQVIDLAAPGENFSTAYFGGETGGNGPTVFGPPDGPPGGVSWYTRNVSGTSFAAPTVAGGAALLYDAAYSLLGATPDARDVRVMKAVLMNSADKTLGWDNGQTAHPNGYGGVRTTQALDNRVGAGRMNLDRAFDQLLAGTTDVPGTELGLLGNVEVVGWDFGLVSEAATNDYLLDTPLRAGSTFKATLSWLRDRRTVGLTSYLDASYDNLDLELWRTVGGTAAWLVAESASLFNNSEHFSFAVPETGNYMLRVRWTDEVFDQAGAANSQLYGLAWRGVAVPEPGATVLAAFAWTALIFSRRRPPSPDGNP